MDKTAIQQALAQERAAILQGDAERIAKQHAQGKGTARERVTKLFDDGSFVEIDALKKDAHLVAGCGTVNGQAVYCFAQDFASCGGAMGLSQAAKIVKVLDKARVTGAPVVALLDSAGVKLADGQAALPAYAEILSAMARLSGVCPLIACVMGPCTGLATLMTQLADVAIQVKKGEIALHPALVMNSEKGKQKTAEQLFGPETMARQGAVALTADTEEDAAALIAALIDLLPGSNMEDAPLLLDTDDLNRALVALDAEDVSSLIADLADEGKVIELYKDHGASIRTALVRLGGRTAGIVANDHAANDGRLCACAARKAARFVRLCDCFQIPVVSLVNTDGMAVPPEDKQGMFLRGAADLLYAYAEATTPKVAVIIGSAVGAAYVAMGGKSIADVSYAWPEAMIAPLTKEAAAQTLSAEQLRAGEDRKKLEADYALQCGALSAAQSGIVDDVIEPAETRKYILAALEMLATKHDVNLPKKHGNLPL